jgi:hypothetical protein
MGAQWDFDVQFTGSRENIKPDGVFTDQIFLYNGEA